MKTSPITNFFRRIGQQYVDRRTQHIIENATQRGRICPYCHGSGIDNNSRANSISGCPSRCPVCGGRGRIPI